MRLTRSQIQFLGYRITDDLQVAGMIDPEDPNALVESIVELITENLRQEDELNEEVRKLLDKHGEQIRTRRGRIPGDVQARQETHGPRAGDHPLMRLTNGKINHLANQVLDLLRADDTVEFFAEDREIRRMITRVINSELEDDEKIDQIVRRKIDSHSRTVQQGTENWEILYRRYYDEEMVKRRRATPGEERDD